METFVTDVAAITEAHQRQVQQERRVEFCDMMDEFIKTIDDTYIAANLRSAASRFRAQRAPRN